MTSEPRAWERPDGTDEDPRAEFNAWLDSEIKAADRDREACRSAAPESFRIAVSRGDALRKVQARLTRLDAATPVARPIPRDAARKLPPGTSILGCDENGRHPDFASITRPDRLSPGRGETTHFLVIPASAQPAEAPDVQRAAPTRDELMHALRGAEVVHSGHRETTWEQPTTDEAYAMADVALGVLRGGGEADAESGPQLIEHAAKTGCCSQCGQPFGESACGPTHASAACVYFGGSDRVTAIKAIRDERDEATQRLRSAVEDAQARGAMHAKAARTAIVSRLARAAGISPDSEDVVGEIEDVIRAGREPEVGRPVPFSKLPDVEAVLAMTQDVDWVGDNPRAFVVNHGIERVSYDRNNFARLLLGLPMRPVPFEVGDVVTGARAAAAPVGTKLGAKSAAVAAVHTTGGWSVTGMGREQDHEEHVRLNEWVVLALGDGGGA